MKDYALENSLCCAAPLCPLTSAHEEKTQLLLCLTKQFYDLTSLLATSEITADLPRFANVI